MTYTQFTVPLLCSYKTSSNLISKIMISVNKNVGYIILYVPVRIKARHSNGRSSDSFDGLRL